MIHQTLPQTYTPENLAVWIKQNALETKNHVEEIDLTEEEIKDLERRSSAASRALDKLKSQLKSIQEIFKKGIDQPYELTIYPTKGTEVLEANRKYADEQIEKGFKEETTVLYAIPWPEKKVVVYVDIEGNAWEEYTRNMTPEESIGFNTMFSEDEKIATGTKLKSAPSSSLDFLED
jgi:hypothetical protein